MNEKLKEFIERFNAKYLEVMGFEPDEDNWFEAHIFGTVMSAWSESSLSCGWCEDAIQERVRQALQDRELPAFVSKESLTIATLYDRAGCMVTLAFLEAEGMHFMPVKWSKKG